MAWSGSKGRRDERRPRPSSGRSKSQQEEGKYGSTAEIAEAEKIDRSFVSRLLDLTLLAPDIQEAILEGRQAKGIQLDELMGAVPSAWEEQRRLRHTASSASSAR